MAGCKIGVQQRTLLYPAGLVVHGLLGNSSGAARRNTYRAVENTVSLVSTFLDMAFKSARIKRLEELKAAEQLARNGHDCPPVVEFSAILDR